MALDQGTLEGLNPSRPATDPSDRPVQVDDLSAADIGGGGWSPEADSTKGSDGGDGWWESAGDEQGIGPEGAFLSYYRRQRLCESRKAWEQSEVSPVSRELSLYPLRTVPACSS